MARRINIAEEQLLLLLRAKDQRGFSILYNNYSGALYGVLNKMLQSNELSTDVLQDVFVKIWKNIDNYDSSKGSIFTWMMNIARNLAIDTLRSADYRDNSLNISIEDKVINQIDDENQTVIEIDSIGLHKVVDKLKPEYKQMIDLAYFKGYTQSEISEEFNIPLGTVKTRIKTAISILKTLI